jgi:hypothetical protein
MTKAIYGSVNGSVVNRILIDLIDVLHHHTITRSIISVVHIYIMVVLMDQ